jgi:hypothetical protein
MLAQTLALFLTAAIPHGNAVAVLDHDLTPQDCAARVLDWQAFADQINGVLSCEVDQ